MTLDRDTLRSLREAELAHLRRWLSGEPARAAWRAASGAILDAVLAQPAATLVDRPALERALAAATHPETLARTVAPAVRFALAEAGRRAAALPGRAADLLGPEARAQWERLASRADLVDRDLALAIAHDEALEAMMRDVLYEALSQFNDKVNPFFAEWGIPALLDRLPLLGKSGLKRAFEGVRDDFNRRLEPEMRRFLEGFAEKSLERMARIALDQANEPEQVRFRRRALAALLDRPVATLAWSPETERGRQLADALGATLVAALAHPEVAAALRRAAAELSGGWGDKSALEVARELGVAIPDVEALADVTWPAIRAAARARGAARGRPRRLARRSPRADRVTPPPPATAAPRSPPPPEPPRASAATIAARPRPLRARDHARARRRPERQEARGRRARRLGPKRAA